MATNLSERQKLILGLSVQEYVSTANPVGSITLVEKYNLDVSSATVRNEMKALKDAGFLRIPHTSGGSIPTEEGYRLFVGELMQRTELPLSTRDTIRHQFYQARFDTNQWMKLAASILAKQSHGAAIVSAPNADKPRYKQLQLISITGRQVLMILVTVGGKVSQQMLVLNEPVTQEQLTSTANQLNNIYLGYDRDEIVAKPGNYNALGQDMFRLLVDEMNKLEDTPTGEIFQDGWTNVLAEPEFAEPETARRALRVLEERPLLKDLLSQTALNSEVGGVQVLIGGEGNWEELSDCSLVLARYGVPDLATGVLGVLGPTRMAYDNTISTVNFVANVLSNMVNEVIGEEQNDLNS